MYDTTVWHAGERTTKLSAPNNSTSGASCDQSKDSVRAQVGQPISVPGTLGKLVNSPGSFSVWWYVVPMPTVYSIHAGIKLEGGYSMEYFYGTSDLANSSTAVNYDLGPVPDTGGWFPTIRNIYADLQPLQIPDPLNVRVLEVWFGAFGCTTQGETAWVDDATLLFDASVFTRPVALFTPSVSVGTAPLVASFDGSDSHATSPGASIVSYSWTSGDGGAGSGVMWTHTFASPGNQSVTLTVEDSNGRISSQTQLISVTSGSPPVLFSPLFYFVSGGIVLSLVFFLGVSKRRFRGRASGSRSRRSLRH